TSIVTTHYERLKVLGASDARFANASVGFDLARLEPTFKLHLGAPGSSGALTVARRMGIAGEVVDRARDLMGPHVVKVEELLASVADQRRRIEEERAALLAELEQAEADRAALRARTDRTLARYEKQTRAAHGEALVARSTRFAARSRRARRRRRSRTSRRRPAGWSHRARRSPGSSRSVRCHP